MKYYQDTPDLYCTVVKRRIPTGRRLHQLRRRRFTPLRLHTLETRKRKLREFVSGRVLDIRVFSAQAAETWRIVTLKKFRFDNLEPASVKSMVFEYTMNSKIET
ncbi:unnamed protein product [Brassica rapa subsp. narinosa]